MACGTVVLLFIPIIFAGFASVERSLDHEQVYEWNLFIIQIRNEINKADSMKATGEGLLLRAGDSTVSYEKYKNLLRRRVDGAGHEALLLNVASSSFTLEHGGILASVKFLNGHAAEARFTVKDERREGNDDFE